MWDQTVRNMDLGESIYEFGVDARRSTLYGAGLKKEKDGDLLEIVSG